MLRPNRSGKGEGHNALKISIEKHFECIVEILDANDRAVLNAHKKVIKI